MQRFLAEDNIFLGGNFVSEIGERGQRAVLTVVSDPAPSRDFSAESGHTVTVGGGAGDPLAADGSCRAAASSIVLASSSGFAFGTSVFATKIYNRPTTNDNVTETDNIRYHVTYRRRWRRQRRCGYRRQQRRLSYDGR